MGANCAAGNLGLVKKENSEPGLVGDSSISCANELFRIREKIELPSLFDIEEFVSRHPRDKWIAFSLDVAKAHKRIRVHPSEQLGYRVVLFLIFLFHCHCCHLAR